MVVRLGTKVGMMRLFDKEGCSHAVTVLDLSGNRVCQIRTKAKDGYSAIQIAHGERRRSRLNRAMIGHLSIHKAGAASRLKEWRLDNDEQSAQFESGVPLGIEEFSEHKYVDVISKSKGRGFAGVIRRYNFLANRATHGNSRAHRKPGSIGNRQDPGRVFPGKKMPGHMGDSQVSAMNLKVEKLDIERGLMFVRGSVPGARSADVIVRTAMKKPRPEVSASK